MIEPILPIDRLALHLDTFPHHHTIETRSSDAVGSGGHIPNGQIAIFGDDARMVLHRTIMGDGEPLLFKLVETQFRFFHELCFPGPITIGVGITDIGRSSIRQIAGFFRDGRCHVLANFALVKVIDGVSVPLDADERARATLFLIPAMDPKI